MAVVALPAYAVSTVMWCASGDWISMFLVSAVYFTLLFAAVFRRIDFRKRAWTVFSAGYVMAAVNLTTGGGLESSGRLYLLVLPVFAFILIGHARRLDHNCCLRLDIRRVLCADPHRNAGWFSSRYVRSSCAFELGGARGITFLMLLVMIITRADEDVQLSAQDARGRTKNVFGTATHLR